MLKCWLIIAKYLARFLYFFMKFFPTKNKVVLISRFNNITSIDFKILIDEIQIVSPDTKIVVLNHKLRSKKLLVIDVLIEMYHLATSKSAIIDSYVIPVCILKHKKSLTIIQIWHSVGVTKKFAYKALGMAEGADKDVARIMHMHENYSYIICSGKNAISIYKECFNVCEDKILNYGIPRIDYLTNESNKINIKNNLYENYSFLKEKKNIVYIPTFRKGKKIPYANIINNINHDKYNLIIKPHPLDKTKISNKECHIIKDVDTLDLLFIADYLITDYSAICFEAALLDIPMFFYLYDYDDYQMRRGLYIDLLHDAPGFASTNELEIIKAIEEEKYDLKRIKEFKKEHIDYTDDLCTKAIVKLLNLGVQYEKETKVIPAKHI